MASPHDFAAMASRIIDRQSFLETEMDIGHGRNHDLIAFDRNPDPLIDAQMRSAGYCRRQTDT
jgi:hypothetical protein